MTHRTRGLGLVAAAAVLWSTAGLFMRALDLDVWTIVVWRSLFAALSLLLIVMVRYGRGWPSAFGRLGWAGLVAVPLSAVSMFSYVAALKLATVANVMVIYATLPFIAAGLALVLIGERMRMRVLWASLVALVGILVVAGGATRPQELAGNAWALLMTATFAINLVLARRYPTLDMAPSNALAAALCALLCWPLASGGLPAPGTLITLAAFGGLTTGLAYLLFLTGGRYLPSSEAGLVGLLDVVLGPLWVWLAFAEQPGRAALVGGGLVLGGVVYYLAGQRDEVVEPATL